MPCNRRSRICPGLRGIGAFNGTGSRAFPTPSATSPSGQRFKRYPLGFRHLDLAAGQTAEG